jgi:hypothetical protein
LGAGGAFVDGWTVVGVPFLLLGIAALQGGEIALSVLAEIIAHDHHRPGGPMRDGSR